MELFLTPDDNLQEVFDGIRQPATVRLSAGIYNQKVIIDADDITLVGESRETTKIVYGDYANKIHADGREYNTFRTFTVCVTGERVRFENLCIENSNTQPEKVGQCVALSVNAKSFRAENIQLRSTQDTLFLAPFPDDLVVRYRDFLPEEQLYFEGKCRHVFKNCKIAGTVDFIFGCAEAIFEECEISSLKDARNIGFVAAPAHSLAEDGGFIFLKCRFSDGGAGAGRVFLARPWRDFGKCTFIDCSLGAHINPALFDKWNDTLRDRTARFSYYGLSCAFAPSPVAWSNRLTDGEAREIIKHCTSLSGEKF